MHYCIGLVVKVPNLKGVEDVAETIKILLLHVLQYLGLTVQH